MSQHTMQAVTQDTYGSADVLEVRTVERPEPRADEVLVRVHAAGLDRGAWHLMTGLPYAVRLAGYGIRAPKNPIPGSELAGTVVTVGEDVTRFAPGEEVFGIGTGAFAEYAVASEAKLAPRPAALTFAQAAAVPISGPTALQALRDQAHVQSGQHVLIVGASGGVGSYAVQLAKAFDAEVTGVASTAKVELVRALGADHVIDYTTRDFADGRQHYDVILDIGGNASLRRLRRALTPTGTLVIVGGETGGRFLGGTDRQIRAMVLSLFVRQKLTSFIAKERYEDLETLNELFEAGSLVPSVDGTYALSEVPQAMRDLEAGRIRGKAVVSVATDH